MPLLRQLDAHSWAACHYAQATLVDASRPALRLVDEQAPAVEDMAPSLEDARLAVDDGPSLAPSIAHGASTSVDTPATLRRTS